MKDWIKTPISNKGINVSCACCGHTSEILPLQTVLYNVFGGWTVTKNGGQYFQESQDTEFSESKTIADIEVMIGDDEENEYCAELFSPLRGATYQRHTKNNWVLIETNEGFA